MPHWEPSREPISEGTRGRAPGRGGSPGLPNVRRSFPPTPAGPPGPPAEKKVDLTLTYLFLSGRVWRGLR